MERIADRILGPHRFATVSPWSVVSAILAVFGVVILSLVAIILAGLAASFFLTDDITHCMARDISSTAPSCVSWLLALLALLSVVFCVLLYLIALARKGSSPANALLLRSSGLSFWQYAALLAVMYGVLFLVSHGISLLTGMSMQEFELGMEYMKTIVSAADVQMWFVIIIAAVVAGPLAEELLFRGFLFTTLIKTRLGFAGTAVITSASWSVLHWNYNWQVVFVLFVFGLGLAYIVWRTGSLWPAIVAHGANNLVSTVVLAVR